jgi:hypothetical protein
MFVVPTDAVAPSQGCATRACTANTRPLVGVMFVSFGREGVGVELVFG